MPSPLVVKAPSSLPSGTYSFVLTSVLDPALGRWCERRMLLASSPLGAPSFSYRHRCRCRRPLSWHPGPQD